MIRNEYLLFIISIFFVNSCFPKPTSIRTTPTIPIVPIEMTDQSWLTDQPCKSPCWYQMQVGETTKEESMELLKKNRFINPTPIREYHIGTFDTVEDQKPENKGIVFNCVQPDGWECAYLEFVSNNLYSIQLNLPYKISFEEVVKKIGFPDYLDVMQNGGPEKTNGCGIRMIWVNRQLIVESFEWGSDSGRDLCYLFYKNGRKPYPNLIVDNIKIIRNEDIRKFEQYKWNGFENVK
jgi:hypothetical protein